MKSTELLRPRNEMMIVETALPASLKTVLRFHFYPLPYGRGSVYGKQRKEFFSQTSCALLKTVLALFALLPHQPVRARPPDPIEIAERAEAARIALIERISPAVVCIYDAEQHGGGSGVLIDEAGYGLTNFHVVAEMLESRHGLAGLPDGKLYDLEVLGIDPGGDVAMFKLSERERFPSARLGDSARVRVGDEVWAMGNPYVLSEDYAPTVSRGIVSGINRYQKGAGAGDTLLYSDCIQVDAAINPGNSGGPLFDARGEVIGINGRISVSDRGRYNVGLGYAITTRQIEGFLPALRAGLMTSHGTLEAVVRDRRAGGVVFSEVREDGPAWKIGIRPGDRLTRFEGREIPTANAYASVLGTLPGNWPVAVTFLDVVNKTHHRIARTGSVHVPGFEKFSPDENVNRQAAQRVIAKFREALRIHKIPATNDSFVREDRVDLATFGNYPPLHTAYQGLLDTMLSARETADMVDRADIRHVGADRLLRLSDDGEIIEDVVLDVLRMPLGTEATRHADYQFGAADHRLRRIIARDELTGDFGEIVFDEGWPNSGHLRVEFANESTSKSHNHLFGAVRLPAGLTIPSTPPNHRHPSTKASAGVGVGSGVGSGAGAEPSTSPLAPAILALTTRTVKLVGARVGRSEGFGSGIMVSSDGLVLTVTSALLDGRQPRAILSDGTELPVTIVRSDRERQLALLRIVDETVTPEDGRVDLGRRTYPFFDLASPVEARAGQWVLAAGNPFKVASGAEPVSISLGALGGRTPLDATRRAVDFPYRGEVWVIDAITSTPGFAGGALCDLNGNLVGMIGRVVESRATFTLLNYAIPREVLATFVDETLAGEVADSAKVAAKARKPVYHGILFFELGYQSNPVYVDRVRRGSPAARAGLRKDDLIIGANGKSIPKLDVLKRVIKDCQAGDTLELTIVRKEKVRRIVITLEETP